ncbi:MAG: exodeoxyribonuclease VII large subunit [Phycisphaerae bacterium]|nr:exodeoxyribonuclease VII large subunit [Phycisphaerae bacterium]
MAERRPFDPSRVEVPASERTPPAGAATLSVRDVNELIRGAISRQVPATLHVLGEISNLSRAGSGHLYFTLKDASSELRCVMWRSTAVKLKFTPEDGMEVIVTGGIEVYAPRGTYQLIARQIEPRGVGVLEVAFRQLKERLEREGLFDPQQKRPLPRVPQRLAVITSPSGAAIRDIIHTLTRRYRALDVLVFPVRVQGEGAAAEIADAIGLMNRHAETLGGIDVAIIGRGGGSLEDLWAFNEEVVARAIAASRIPIVSAVGHEVDVSISDLVADVRAATPTAAAELLTPSTAELLEWLASRETRTRRTVAHQLELARSHLRATLAYDGLANPLRPVLDGRQMLDDVLQQVARARADLAAQTQRRISRAELALVRFGSGAQFARVGHGLQQRAHRLDQALTRVTRQAERQLTRKLDRLEHHAPGHDVRRLTEHLRMVRQQLGHAMLRALSHGRALFEARLEAVAACDPRSVLRRGYSITRDAKTRKIIRSVEQIRDKMRIITQVADGEFRGTADDPRQGELFD